MKFAFEGHTEAERAALLFKLYTGCVSAAKIYGGIHTTPDDLGAVIWLPGRYFPLTLTMEIRSGMWTLPVQLGQRATLRLMSHDRESEGWIKKHAGRNMGYIWCVGVSVQARGRGYSRALIDESIDQMRLLGLNECWLKTEDPKNVTIYEKLGFTLMNHMVVKSSSIDSWAMRKMI
jgi:GNAT superfamily N-acetyltransferase